jgi:hypothetical protein
MDIPASALGVVGGLGAGHAAGASAISARVSVTQPARVSSANDYRIERAIIPRQVRAAQLSYR